VIVAFTGNFGAGKSALCSLLAVQAAASRGCGLWANYSLRGSSPVRTVDDLYACRGGVIVLDELQSTVNSRTFGRNEQFMLWFDQCRKQRSELYLVTQQLRKIDVIVRNAIDLEFRLRHLQGDWSELLVFDVQSEASRGSARRFDRSGSYGLYDSYERAWPLLAGAEAGASRPVAGKGSAPAIVPGRRSALREV
jgi:ABC-type thiamine transport system ATPase subunit